MRSAYVGAGDEQLLSGGVYRCYRVVGEGDEEVVAGRELSRDRGERT